MERQGASHEIWRLANVWVIVPRRREISELTARRILKGLDARQGLVATMTVYKVDFERDGKWWAIRVPALPGVFSQARRRGQVEAMARDAIALYLDVPPYSFAVSTHRAPLARCYGEREEVAV